VHRLFAACLGTLVFVLTAALTGCDSGTSASTRAVTAAQSEKQSFCTANDALDKASANVTTDSGFMAVLKAHRGEIETMIENVPGGTIGAEARMLLDAVKAAIASGDVGNLTSPTLNAAGADIDTYCGVDGDGDPLPSYFAAGKASSFCSVFGPIQSAVSDASSATQVLAALKSDQSQVAELGSDAAALPAAVRSQARDLVDITESAISSNSTAPLQTSQGARYFTAVQLYCGINQ